jgi:branched-chain amino acid transport system ATP-binding protein
MIGAQRQARAGFWSALGGLPRSDRDERALRSRALDALDRVGAPGLADAMPNQLAFGVRKRVALARALVAEPRLLLLDEPAGGLSEAEIDDLRELITGLSTATTVLLVEHRMDLVMAVCQAVVVLDFGRVIARGTPDQVQADPAVTAAYLGTEDTDGVEGPNE